MKAHLYETDEPIITRRDVTAMCGAVINKAQPVFMWDSVAVGNALDLSNVKICQKCPAAGFTDKRYLYGIVDGKEQETAEGA